MQKFGQKGYGRHARISFGHSCGIGNSIMYKQVYRWGCMAYGSFSAIAMKAAEPSAIPSLAAKF